MQFNYLTVYEARTTHKKR